MAVGDTVNALVANIEQDPTFRVSGVTTVDTDGHVFQMELRHADPAANPDDAPFVLTVHRADYGGGDSIG